MHKGDNYQKDFNKDEKKDGASFRSRSVVVADAEHGAYRPRMNALYTKGDCDAASKED